MKSKIFNIHKVFKNFFWLLFFIVIALGVFLSFQSNLVYADTNSKENSLTKIKLKVQKAEDSLKTLEEDIDKLNGEVTSLNKKILKLKNEKEKTVQEREKNQKELKALEESIQKLRIEAFKLIKRSKGRINALYKERPVQDLLSFIFSDKNNNGSRIAYYVAKIRNYDKKLMVEIITLKKDYQRKSERQKRIIAKNLALEEILIISQNQEQKEVEKKKEMLRLLTQKESQMEKELDELRAQALRIEIVLKSVTNGEDIFLREEEKKAKSKEKDKGKDKQVALKKVEPFTGQGLSLKKGKLPLPVRGKIVKNFGKHQVKKFKDFVVLKGVEFLVPNGTQAFAVASGKVIYEGKMPGYGKMIILDHGKRYYTLYSHLASINAKLGNVLKTGDLVGICEPSSGGSNFYFEIRKEGQPIDPKLYLDLKGQA